MLKPATSRERCIGTAHLRLRRERDKGSTGSDLCRGSCPATLTWSQQRWSRELVAYAVGCIGAGVGEVENSSNAKGILTDA
jgi:hypothetical protein